MLANIKFFNCISLYFLAGVIFCGGYFAFWIFADSDDDKVRDALVEFGKYALEGKKDEGYAFLNKTLQANDSHSMDPIWLKLISVNNSGYDRLDYYMKVMRADPDREATYQEIANFIELAPKVFHDEVKVKYLEDLNAIPGINLDWLVKYDLISASQ